MGHLGHGDRCLPGFTLPPSERWLRCPVSGSLWPLLSSSSSGPLGRCGAVPAERARTPVRIGNAGLAVSAARTADQACAAANRICRDPSGPCRRVDTPHLPWLMARCGREPRGNSGPHSGPQGIAEDTRTCCARTSRRGGSPSPRHSLIRKRLRAARTWRASRSDFRRRLQDEPIATGACARSRDGDVGLCPGPRRSRGVVWAVEVGSRCGSPQSGVAESTG